MQLSLHHHRTRARLQILSTAFHEDGTRRLDTSDKEGTPKERKNKGNW